VLRRAIPGLRWPFVGVFNMGGEKDEASEVGEYEISIIFAGVAI